MTFLHNKTKLRNQTKPFSKKYFIGSLPATSFDSSAVEFYSNPIINSINNSINYSGRPCLYTSITPSNTLNGNLTIEASISIPLFMIVISVLISITSALYLQLSMQIALEETVRQASKTAYISNLFLSLDEEYQQTISANSVIMDNITTSLLSATYLKTVFTKEDNEKLVNSPMIINGSKGLHFYSSSIDLDEGIADIILSYKVELPFLPENIFNFSLTNRCYIRLYTGKELAKKQTATDTYVYFTSHGSVFHFNRYCQYLLNYTDAKNYKALSPDISKCARCVTITTEQLKEQNPIVYITKSQEFFHTSLNCPTFTGDVFRASYSSLNDSDKICQQCLKGK